MERIFKDKDGQTIAATIYGQEENPLVILLHGGGQTRHAWDQHQKIFPKQDFMSLLMI